VKDGKISEEWVALRPLDGDRAGVVTGEVLLHWKKGPFPEQLKEEEAEAEVEGDGKLHAAITAVEFNGGVSPDVDHVRVSLTPPGSRRRSGISSDEETGIVVLPCILRNDCVLTVDIMGETWAGLRTKCLGSVKVGAEFLAEVCQTKPGQLVERWVVLTNKDPGDGNQVECGRACLSLRFVPSSRGVVRIHLLTAFGFPPGYSSPYVEVSPDGGWQGEQQRTPAGLPILYVIYVPHNV
jgi:hypothetical protein